MKIKIYYAFGIFILINVSGLIAMKGAPRENEMPLQNQKEAVHFLHVLLSVHNSEGKVITLEEAIIRNRKQTVTRMLSEGTHDINAQDELGWTPLILAIHLKHKEIINLLLTDAKIDTTIRDSSGKTAYEWALAEGLNTLAQQIAQKRGN